MLFGHTPPTQIRNGTAVTKIGDHKTAVQGQAGMKHFAIQRCALVIYRARRLREAGIANIPLLQTLSV